MYVTLDILPEVDGLLLGAVLLPLLWAAGLSVAPLRRALTGLSPLAAIPALLVAVFGPSGHTESYPGLLLDTRFKLDEVGALFLTAVAFVWLLAGFSSRGGDTGRRHSTRYFVFFLLTMSGNLGVTVVRDLPGFLFFFSLMGLSSYGLVAHHQTRRALGAAKIYMGFLIVGEALLFAGAVWAASETNSLSAGEVAEAILSSPNAALMMGLFVCGFGIKAGFVPLHVSLPPAYRCAPASAAAALSGAATKAGLIGWMLFLPVGVGELTGLGYLFFAGGLLAIFYGVVVGLMQRHPKAMLAYSSVSQIGFMTLLMGFGMFEPDLWPLAQSAVVIYALHHALNKAALFLGEPIARKVPDELAWLARLGLLLPALALAGAPLSSGAVAKHALSNVVDVAAPGQAGWLGLLISVGAIGTSLLMIRFLRAVWPSRRHSGHATPEATRWVPWALMVIAAVFFAWALRWYPLSTAANEVVSWSALAAATWPLALATLVGGLVIWLRDHLRWLTDRHLPPGDLLVPLLAVSWAVVREGDRVVRWGSNWWRRIEAGTVEMAHSSARRLERLKDVEEFLSQWHVGATLFLLLAATLYLFVWLL